MWYMIASKQGGGRKITRESVCGHITTRDERSTLEEGHDVIRYNSFPWEPTVYTYISIRDGRCSIFGTNTFPSRTLFSYDLADTWIWGTGLIVISLTGCPCEVQKLLAEQSVCSEVGISTNTPPTQSVFTRRHIWWGSTPAVGSGVWLNNRTMKI